MGRGYRRGCGARSLQVMGLNWTALEQGLQRAATQKAAQIMADHPGQHFYGLALHGVPTEEDGVLVLPVLALNSEEALVRDLSEEGLLPVDPDDDEDDVADEEEGGDWVEPPLDGSDPPEPDEDAGDDSDGADEAEDDGPDLDADLEADSETDDSAGGFYSRRWDPTDWHWNAVDLVEEAAAGIWERAFAAEVEANGWETTALRYYGLMVRVTRALRDDPTLGGGGLVCFVADDDHAERLLRACLTEQQLGHHFPELGSAPGEGQEGLVDA